MKSTNSLKLASAIFLAGAVTSAAAQVVRYDVTGVTYGATGGEANGRAVSAFVVADYGAFPYSTYGLNSQSKFSNVTDPSAVYGKVIISGGPTLDIGAGTAGNKGRVDLIRDPSTGGFNLFSLSTVAVDSDNGFVDLVLQAFDFSGSATNLFSTPARELSVSQPINFLGDGVTAFGTYEYSDPQGLSKHTANFAISSVTISAITAVPEPQTYALMLAGLVGMAAFATQRRRLQL